MRRATIRTTHDDAELVAAAIDPDNTAEMETSVDRSAENGSSIDGGDDENGGTGRVVTRIERETTGGLHSNVDDYVVNVDVATTVAQRANESKDADASDAIRDDRGSRGTRDGTESHTTDTP